MSESAIPIVIFVVSMALICGYINNLAAHPEITLKTELDKYDGTFQPGTNITNTPTGEGTSILDIPVLGDILSFLAWIIPEEINMINGVAGLPAIFPDWMQPIFAVGFIFFVIYVYVMLMPGKQ